VQRPRSWIELGCDSKAWVSQEEGISNSSMPRYSLDQRRCKARKAPLSSEYGLSPTPRVESVVREGKYCKRGSYIGPVTQPVAGEDLFSQILTSLPE